MNEWFLEGKRRARRARQFRDVMVIKWARGGSLVPLINLLLSREELSPKVRSFVADFLEGKVNLPKHRPSADLWGDFHHFRRVFELEQEGWKRTAAVTQVATEFRCCQRTVQTSLSKWGPALNAVVEAGRRVRRVVELENEGWQRADACSKAAKDFGCQLRRVQRSVSDFADRQAERVWDLEDEGIERAEAVRQTANECSCTELTVLSSLAEVELKHKAKGRKLHNRGASRSRK